MFFRGSIDSIIKKPFFNGKERFFVFINLIIGSSEQIVHADPE